MELVERMRQAQNDYFAYRATETLQLSKDLERQVDHYIDQAKNPGLF